MAGRSCCRGQLQRVEMRRARFVVRVVPDVKLLARECRLHGLIKTASLSQPRVATSSPRRFDVTAHLTTTAQFSYKITAPLHEINDTL
jgi:hypothetical protein